MAGFDPSTEGALARTPLLAWIHKDLQAIFAYRQLATARAFERAGQEPVRGRPALGVCAAEKRCDNRMRDRTPEGLDVDGADS